jgi:hypothetical protein
MERIDIPARSGPDRLAAGGVQKADPHHDVIAVGSQRVGRAHAVQRQIKEEAVEVRVIRNAVAENDRNVAVETFRRSTLLDGDARNRRFVIHRLFNLPPDPIRALASTKEFYLARHYPGRPPPAMWERCGRPG